jgi:hypothetical protein
LPSGIPAKTASRATWPRSWTAARGVNGQEGGRRVPALLTLLGLAGVLAGFLLTALARAKKLGGDWEDRGLWAIFGGFGLIMIGVGLAIATAG